MKGAYEVTVQNRRVRYRFTVSRNLTILRGDSATGKTTLIEMLMAHQAGGVSSGITVICKRQCIVLTDVNWEANLALARESIVFIDEGADFVTTRAFAAAARESTNYYVIASRSALPNLPYSVTEVYGIRNSSGNRYQGTKRLYSTFYPLYEKFGSKDGNKNRTMDGKKELRELMRPDLVITEDSNAGYEFFSHICGQYGIPCISAGGKTRVYQTAVENPGENILIIADGAAYGPEIELTLSISRVKNVGIYLPESFEWLILKSGLIRSDRIDRILENPQEEIESSRYFSWEQFFTALLVQESQGTYLQYRKSRSNPAYRQTHETDRIMAVMPQGLIGVPAADGVPPFR